MWVSISIKIVERWKSDGNSFHRNWSKQVIYPVKLAYRFISNLLVYEDNETKLG